MELDIWIPSVKIAVEVNGPVHYKPLYGEERFLQAQKNDTLKSKEAKEKGILLICIDVGSETYKRKYSDMTKEASYLVKKFVKPILKKVLPSMPVIQTRKSLR